MTNPTRIIAANQSADPSSNSSQTELSVNQQAIVAESGTAEMLSDNCGENTLAPRVPEVELPPVIPVQNRKALFQKRQEEFPALTAKLEELAKVRDDLAEAARKYQSDLRLLPKDLEYILQLLEGTLDDPADGIHFSVDSHGWLLRYSALALDGLANVIDVLLSRVQLPIQTNVLRNVASRLDFILDPEGKFHAALETDQHWVEADLAESGLWSLMQQIENLKGFIELDWDVDADPSDAENEESVQEAIHSKDFRCVNWFGTVYTFTPGQAGAVKALWEAWESGVPSISSVVIADAAGGDSTRVRDIFKYKGGELHAAWETMICKVEHFRDMYSLQPPAGREIPT